ncbi:MAG TPA: FAD-dependent oxidoreductase, partial [Paracoccaceae bacterium]|nr:FAD-dependent oxidoreductase [Paracoccaceae bacterium]
MTFPVTLSAPLVDPGPFPAAADVAVVGGGIAGVMTAWHLADLGLRAVVLEKGRVAGEQSGRNWGWIRAQGRDPAELPLILDARRQWEGLAAALGPGLGHRRCGVLYLAGSATEMAGFEAWLPHAQAHGLDTELWPRAAAADRLGPAGGWQGALWTASDARAEPWAALPLIARAAVTKGVRIIEGCAARALDLAGGRVAGVVTERGRIAAPAVVVAGGAWSRLFLCRHGVG